MPLRLESAACSHPGSYLVNEDATGIATAMGHTLLGVADGLGGHAHGEVAARCAIQRTVELFERHPSIDAQAVKGWFLGAHQTLRERHSTSGASGPRTTLVLVVFDGVAARLGHVGDSRVYFLRDGKVRTRTRDHSVPELLRRAGEIGDDEIRHHPDRGRILQALGQPADPRITVSDALTMRAGDVFLLCSDGWWECVPDEAMERSLQMASRPQAWLTQMADMIAAASSPRQDNYSAVAAFVR